MAFTCETHRVFTPPCIIVLSYYNRYCILIVRQEGSAGIVVVFACCNLIIINVTHISLFGIIFFNSGRNVTKLGRITKRGTVTNLADPKFGLRSFRPSSCHFYGRRHI